MNTSIQIKTHTNKSASKKNVHILRESEAYMNVDIEVLKKTVDYKFQDDVTPPVARADVKSEQQRQAELRKVNNKINTYKKRLEVFKAQNNSKKVESLGKQIAELQKEKEHLKQSKTTPETRGKKRSQNYVEFELSLTNSNHLKYNPDVQQALKRAVAELQKEKVLKELETITEVIHKDQHSLHVHWLSKVPTGKTWDSIIENGREVYKHLQDKFNSLMRKELSKLDLQVDSHSSGKRYVSLKEYKRLNPLGTGSDDALAKLMDNYDNAHNESKTALKSKKTRKNR